jgi:phosphoglycerate dehydrogenase-like enzyme
MTDITILALSDPGRPELARIRALPGIEFVVGRKPDDFREAASRAIAIMNWMGDRGLLRDICTLAPEVRWLHYMWAGLDGMLFPELLERGIEVTNGRGVYSEALGEFAIAAMLYFAKDIPRMLRGKQEHKWDPFEMDWISGRTVGIVGYGEIGRAVARRAAALGMNVLAIRRRPELAKEDPSLKAVYGQHDLARMLEQTDYLVASAPLTPETRGMIGARELAGLRPGAVVINIGRGAVIQEQELVKALENGGLRGAALDVFETEPLPSGHPFYRLENVLLSPHCADRVPGWLEKAVDLFIENVKRFRAGRPLLNVIDKNAGY